MEESDQEVEVKVTSKKTKRQKVIRDEEQRGVIYLSSIPSQMTVKKIRHLFQQYGDVDRIFLQPEVSRSKVKKKGKEFKTYKFAEGWVEFIDKKLAKRVVLSLNNTQIGGKRHNPWYWDLWNMKYLTKFKWTHLNERLAYEKAVHQQRMRTEISQAKREASFFAQNLEKGKYQDRMEKKLEKKGEKLSVREWNFKQKNTEQELLAKKRKKESDKKDGSEKKPKKDPYKAATDKQFLKTLFSGGADKSDDDV